MMWLHGVRSRQDCLSTTRSLELQLQYHCLLLLLLQDVK